VDFEPGIHYSQIQMQSGTTGINALRIYNPIKQSGDQDPLGQFIKQWVPELASVPQTLIHTPWLAKNQQYPKPLVDEKIQRLYASKTIYTLRKSIKHKNETQPIIQKHASRKKRKIRKDQPPEQTEFML